jgi:hypothetical protein
VLYLYGNALTSLPPEVGQLTALQSLGLHHNQLTSLPPWIGRLTALQDLGVHANQLTALPPEIGQLKKLRKFLYLSENRLTLGGESRAIRYPTKASRPPSSKPQTANAQQRRHDKALMRHTAVNCFPFQRVAFPVNESRATPQLRKHPGPRDGVEILVSCHRSKINEFRP